MRSKLISCVLLAGCVGDAGALGVEQLARAPAAVGVAGTPNVSRWPAAGQTEKDASTPPPDAGTDGGALDAGRRCDQLMVCDDFEANAVGNAPAGWSVVLYPSTVGTVEVDATHAFSGTKSVRLSYEGNDSPGLAQIARDLVVTPNAFYGRMRLWLTRTPRNPQHWNLIEGWGYAQGTTQRRLEDQAMYMYGGGGPGRALDAAYVNWTTDCCLNCGMGPPALPLGRWACVEWQFDGVNNEMRFWVDGQAIDALTVTHPQCGGTWRAPVFEQVRLGWWNAPREADGPMEMWMDDVALDAQRIGCR